MKTSQKKPGVSASIVMSPDGKNAEGIEISGYLGKNVTVAGIKKLARDLEESVGAIIDKLAS